MTYWHKIQTKSKKSIPVYGEFLEYTLLKLPNVDEVDLNVTFYIGEKKVDISGHELEYIYNNLIFKFEAE